MTKRLIFYASAFGFLSVAFGAFGAHKLKELIAAENILTFETGVRYQFFHALAIISAALLFDRYKIKQFYRSGLCFIGGIILFSGSLYLLSCRDLLGIEQIKILGPITPLGGLFFLVGWLLLFAGALKIKDNA